MSKQIKNNYLNSENNQNLKEDDSHYFIENVNTIKRSQYGGIETISNIGVADLYGRNGNVTPEQNLADLIIKNSSNDAFFKNFRDNYIKKFPKYSHQQNLTNKYGWQQDVVEIEGISCARGISLIYTFPTIQDMIQNPILVFESEELKELAHEWDGDLNDLVYLIVKDIEVEIGGQRIERIFGQMIKFMQMLYQLDYYFERNRQLLKKGKFYLPLPIDCLSNHTFRICSLQYHSLKIRITFNCDKITMNPNLKLKYQTLFLNPILREYLTSVAAELVIKQVQYTGVESLLARDKLQRFPLGFNHPCLGILIYLTDSDGKLIKNNEIFEKVLICNGKRILFEGDSDYLRYEGLLQLGLRETLNNSQYDGFYWFPFGRKEDLSLESSLRTFSAFNFNRHGFDHPNIKIQLTDDFIEEWEFHEIGLHIAAINYHIIRIMGGMIGLALSK